jgi:hypothetical protein
MDVRVSRTISNRRIQVGEREIELDEAVELARRASGWMKPGVREITPPDLSELGSAGAAAQGAWQIVGTGVNTLVGLPVTIAANLFGVALLAGGAGAAVLTAGAAAVGGVAGGLVGAGRGAVGMVRGRGRGLLGDTLQGAKIGAASGAIAAGGLSMIALTGATIAAAVVIGLGNTVANVAGTLAGVAAAVVGGAAGGVASVLKAPFLRGRSGADSLPKRDELVSSVDLRGVGRTGRGLERTGVESPQAPGPDIEREVA